MNEFDAAFAPTFDVSLTVFGDTCKINNLTLPCVILELSLTSEIQPGRAGQSQVAGGSVLLGRTAWVSARGKKGVIVAVGGGIFRVSNDPDVDISAGNTVTLQLGPQT